MSTSLQLINHASVLIKHGEISLLSDPWYQGDAFHKGWNLIHELTDEEIMTLLDQVTHIWISHEHPDHFSIMFFKKFGDQIKDRNIRSFIDLGCGNGRVLYFFNKKLKINYVGVELFRNSYDNCLKIFKYCKFS